MNTTVHQFRQTPNPATSRGSSLQGPMRLADLVYGPWALLPEHLLELQAIYETHLRGEKIDIGAIEARLGRPLANEQRAYQIVNGVAVLPIQGVISPKANLMTQISGGASAQMLIAQVQSAAADTKVDSLILAVDSPGGNVLGMFELSQAVRDLAAGKPVVTHSDGQLASAAYLIGSAANSIYVSGPMVQVGSIGVVSTHKDISAAEAKMGVKTTHITAGKYKRIVNENEPLSTEGHASMQAKVDYIYGLLVDAVADARGASVEAVLEHMADGRVFIGQQAIDAGLVDGVSTIDALIEQLATDPARFATRKKARIANTGAGSKQSKGAGAAAEDDLPSLESTGESSMADPKPITRAVLEAEHAPLLAELRTTFMAEGAAAESARVKAVREQLIPGHEALIDKLATDGKTTGGEAAMAINAAERQAREAAIKAHKGDAPNAARASAAGDDAQEKTKAEQRDEAKAYAAKHNVSFIAAMKALGFAS